MDGNADLLSEGRRVRFQLVVNRPDYGVEQFALNGDTATIGHILPARRSGLGDFLFKYPDPVSEGLLGGVLTTAWPLAHLAAQGPKLVYNGLKKVNGKMYHEDASSFVFEEGASAR